MWEGQREGIDEKVESTSAFLISFLLPVSERLAPTVSIATADGGSCSEKVEWMVEVRAGGCKGPRAGPSSDEMRVC